MGDMADYLSEQEEYDDEYADEVACKYCGERGLQWKKALTGWRLFYYDTDDIHTCNKHPSTRKKKNGKNSSTV